MSSSVTLGNPVPLPGDAFSPSLNPDCLFIHWFSPTPSPAPQTVLGAGSWQSFAPEWVHQRNQNPENTLNDHKALSSPSLVCVTTPHQALSLKGDGCAGVYIPGEFCRQGDLLEAAGSLAKPVFLERGSFLSPRDLMRALPKLGPSCSVTLVDAGSAFGYADRIFDPRAAALYRANGVTFGIHLSSLLGLWPRHQPRWLQEPPSKEHQRPSAPFDAFPHESRVLARTLADAARAVGAAFMLWHESVIPLDEPQLG